MEIDIPEDTQKKISEASRKLGIDEEELVDKAILHFLNDVNEYVEIKKEFDQWEKLSDEALVKFEKSL